MTAPSGRYEVEANCDVLIQGAGIGGLTLAIALQKLNYSVRVVERATALVEVGAGIWMAANAMQVFDRLGFADSIIGAGWAVKTLRLQDWKAGDLQRTELSSMAEAYGFETIALERAVLQHVLLEQLCPGTVHFNCQVELVAESGNQTVATLSDGSSCAAKLLIGADGINSEMRRLAGLGGEKRYSGSSSYRAIARGAHLLSAEEQHTAYEIWAEGCRIGFSKISANDYYWYMTFDAAAGECSSASEIRGHAESLFSIYFPQWAVLLEKTQAQDIVRADIHDLKRLQQWSAGRIGLVGDAAHATTPNLGQGGGMAVEDALALAAAFRKVGLNETACKSFEQQRRKKVDWTVSTSRSIGRICHLSNPLARQLRNIIVRKTPESVARKQLHRIYSLEPSSVL